MYVSLRKGNEYKKYLILDLARDCKNDDCVCKQYFPLT